MPALRGIQLPIKYMIRIVMYSTTATVLGALLHCARAVQLRGGISCTNSPMGKSHCYLSFKKEGGVWGQRVYGDSLYFLLSFAVDLKLL